VVTSTFGAMFAPDHQATARELIRVLRPDGRLGMATWTPDGWVGAQLDLLSRCLSSQSGGAATEPPTVGGTRESLEKLFAGTISELRTKAEYFDFVHLSTRDLFVLFVLFKDSYGPVATAMARLGPAEAERFAGEWIALADEHNSATDETCFIASPYLQVVAVKSTIRGR
jgi:SAM-dependent methyltransferase